MKNVGIVALSLLLYSMQIMLIGCNKTAQNSSVNDLNVIEDSLSVMTLFNKANTNRDSTTFFIAEADAVVQKSKAVKLQSLYTFLLGKTMINSGKIDSANSLADKGLQLKYSDSEQGLKGKFFNIKGNVAGLKKQVYQSIEYYLQAEKLFQQSHDTASLAGIYCNVANSYFSLKDYNSAHQYATKAYHLRHLVMEPNILSNIITTYALSLNKVGKNKEALPIVKMADSVAEASQNKMAKIAATIGLAEVFKSIKQFDSAVYYYNSCMQQSKKLGIKHFELMSKLGLLSMYEEQGKTKAILNLYDSTINLAQQVQNIDVLHTTNRIAGKAYAQEGQYQKGFALLSASYQLYDSVAGIENQKNINELLVKYDAEQNEKEILSQHLQLAEQKVQLRNRQVAIFGLIAGLGVLSLIIFYVRKLNKERLLRLEIEKQKKTSDAYIHGEQKERTRLAFEIHDGIASMLTGISYKLRGANANKEEVLQLLSTLHEDTRRISHSLMPINFEQKSLAEAVQNLCEKMSTPEIDIQFFAHKNTSNINAQESLLLYRIIQELINNALKYAQCKSIFVSINWVEKNIEITVDDDGIGIDQKHIEQGFGSIKQRIKSLNAQMHINTQLQEGTTVKIVYSHE